MKLRAYYPDGTVETLDAGGAPEVGTCFRIRENAWRVNSSQSLEAEGSGAEWVVDVHVEPAERRAREWVAMTDRTYRLLDYFDNSVVVTRAEVRDMGDLNKPVRFTIAKVNDEEFQSWETAMARAEEIVAFEDAKSNA